MEFEMSKSVYKKHVLSDSRSTDLKDHKNSYEDIYMNEVSDTQVIRSNKTSDSEARNVGCGCYRLAAMCLLILVLLLLAAITLLLFNYTNITKEREQLQTSYNNITKERDQLQLKIDELQKRYSRLKEDINTPGWTYFSSSIYFISTEEKSWTESRQDCRKRGADLVIINNRAEQDFVEVWRRNVGAWIGANDTGREGHWEWVDGSAVNNGFWSRGEPNNKGEEDCAVSGYRSEPIPNWVDVSCDSQYIWICEKRIAV